MRTFVQKGFFLCCFLIYSNIFAQNITDGVSVNSTATPEKPHWLRDISVQFPATADLTNIWNLRVMLVVGKHTFGTQTAARSISFSGKMVDAKTRKFNFQLGGLSADTDYTLHLLIDTRQCGADAPISINFHTDKAPQYEQVKALIVLDDDLKNDAEIQKKITQYIEDARYTQKPVEAETYTIGNTIQEKKKLFDYLKANAITRNIRYLFFVGTNALMPITQRTVYSTTNVLKSEEKSEGFSVYTNLLNNEIEWDEQTQQFASVNYQTGSVCMAGSIDLRNRVTDSRYADISFGALIPTQQGLEAKKTLALNYFEKLHRFKTGALNFDKKILFSDSNNGDDYLKTELLGVARWKDGNKFVRWGHTPSIAYNGTDIIWKDDYLSKISNDSYEMLMLNVHGSATTHFYGISSGEIKSLPKLNTLFLNFFSCSVGDYKTNNYLAGTYLENGNSLFINAFTTEIFVSNFKNTFTPNQPYDCIARGDAISDAIRNAYGYLGAHIFLGDPLLSLDSKVSITATEPEMADLLSVYPNPIINNSFSVKNNAGTFSLQLSDLQGRIVGESILKNGEERIFDTQQLPSGTILLKATDLEGRVFVKKLVK